jgi:hypothetical protein
MFTLATIRAEELAIVGIIFGGGFTVAIVGMITGAIRDVFRSRHQEESRREIAAYVAEGSISPDDAAKILAAGGSIKDRVVRRLGL